MSIRTVYAVELTMTRITYDAALFDARKAMPTIATKTRQLARTYTAFVKRRRADAVQLFNTADQAFAADPPAPPRRAKRRAR